MTNLKDNSEYYYLDDLQNYAKITENGSFLLTHEGWRQVERYFITDRIVGFDHSEPEGSPYRFGNTSMITAHKVTKEEVKRAEESQNRLIELFNNL